MPILFYGDPHGRFVPLFDAVAEHRPEHVVIAGDLELDVPLAKKLAELLSLGVRIHWIHGNHDAHTDAMHDNLFDSQGSLHARAERLHCREGSAVVAGLGGHYKGRIWFPRQGDEEPRFRTREDFLQGRGVGGRYRGGLPLGQRQAIFPEDHAALSGLRGVDVLVTHEAPTSVDRNMGFGAIDDTARDMSVSLVVHGHHHVAYQGSTRDGIPVRGLALAEPWLFVPRPDA